MCVARGLPDRREPDRTVYAADRGENEDMIDLPKAIRHLHAWNDGNPDNYPEGYDPGALEWQKDLI